MSKLSACVSLCLFLSFLSGCGGRGPTGTVTGKITKDGKPIAAQVSYKGESSTASATSDPATGIYTLRSGQVTDIPVGTYQIAVSEVSSAVDTQSADYAAMMTGGASGSTPKSSEIPAKYKAFGTSGLEFTVNKGENTFDIELE